MQVNRAEYKSTRKSGSLFSYTVFKQECTYERGLTSYFLLLGASNKGSKAFHINLADSKTKYPICALAAMLQDSTKCETDVCSSLS